MSSLFSSACIPNFQFLFDTDFSTVVTSVSKFYHHRHTISSPFWECCWDFAARMRWWIQWWQKISQITGNLLCKPSYPKNPFPHNYHLFWNVNSRFPLTKWIPHCLKISAKVSSLRANSAKRASSSCVHPSEVRLTSISYPVKRQF